MCVSSGVLALHLPTCVSVSPGCRNGPRETTYQDSQVYKISQQLFLQ